MEARPPLLKVVDGWLGRARENQRLGVDDSDEGLARAAAEGDQSAFGELVRRYQDKIYSIVVGQLHDREEAVDLTQEVFIKAFRGLHHFRGESSFYTWLYRITLHVCIDAQRRRPRQAAVTSLDDEAFADGGLEPPDERVAADPERALMNDELGEMLLRCIRTLPAAMRDALLLRDVAGLSQADVASIMRCPLGTAKRRIQRARDEVRRRVGAYLSDEIQLPQPACVEAFRFPSEQAN